MDKIKSLRLYGTTNTSGAATIASAENAVANGLLYAVEWIDGTFDDGVDAVLSVTKTPSGVDQTLLTLTDANNDAWYYPRILVHDAAGTALTGTSGGDRERAVINGVLSLAVTSGGASKSGGCIVYYNE